MDTLPPSGSPPGPHPLFSAGSFDAMLAAFGLPAHAVQCFDPAHPHFDAQRPLLVLREQFSAARAAVRERYPASHPAQVLATAHGGRRAPGEAPDEAAEEQTVAGLLDDGTDSGAAAAAAWLIEPLAAEQDLRGLLGLRAVMERLVGPDGCPWDRQQTHSSLRKYLLEETYEAVDAIDRGDPGALSEELGDLLMQIMLHAAIGQQHDTFALEDVLAGITAKMVRRHPHVFAGETVQSQAELLGRWDQIKAEERAARGDDTPGAPLDAVPLALPALQRAQSLLSRMAGLDAGPAASETADDPAGGLAAVREALDRLERLVGAGDEQRTALVGALLWAVAGHARTLDVDAEQALREQSVRIVEQAVAGSG